VKKKTINIIFTKIPSYLLVLLPFFLITGPFLSDLAVSLISIIFFFNTYLNKNLSRYYRNYFFYFFLIFWIYLLLNSILNNPNIDSFRIALTYFRFFIFAIATWYILDQDKKILLYLFYSFLLCFLALIIDGYYQFFFNENLIGYKIQLNRISSFFGDELILGSYLSRLFPIFFGIYILFHDEMSKKYSYLLILIFPLIEALIFLSGERSALFYLNLSTIFIIIMIKKFKNIRFFSFILGLILILFITFIDNSYKIRIIDHTLNQIVINEDKFKLNIFSEQHTAHYNSSLKIFSDNKYFGVGIKNFRYFCSEKKYNGPWACSSHSHNTYIQLLAETGIIGFLFIFFLFILLIYYSLIHLKGFFKNKQIFNDFEICLLSSILISLWPVIPSGNFFNNWLCIIYFFPCGILLWSLNNRKSTH
jgi:O-antigen ligase